MKSHMMSFEGALLERGFWLYLWKISSGSRTVLYVGRTGDSSSPHASSPFRRVGQHLDSKENARGNTMHRQLTKEGLVPESCRFEMLALGPLFPEQVNMDAHKVYRDRAATLERALADHLRDLGHKVIGTHPRERPLDGELVRRFSEVCQAVQDFLPMKNQHRGPSC